MPLSHSRRAAMTRPAKNIYGMVTMRRVILLAVLLLAGIPAQAAVLTVESVLSPAWIERANGRREPLAVGMELNSKEKVHTGDGGRAMLRLAEGSAIKLGEGG